MVKWIIWFVTCFISTLGVAFVYYKYSDVKKKFKLNSFLVFIVGVLLVTIIQYYELNFIGQISYFIFYPALFETMKKVSGNKLFYYVIIIWLYGVALDLLAMAIVSLLHLFINFNIYGYIFESLLTFVVFVLFIFIAYNKKIKKFTNNLYDKIIKIRYFDISLIFFSIFVFLICTIIFLNLKNLSINLLLWLLIISVVIMFITLIKNKINEIENAIFLRTLKENNDFYIKMEDENRVFRHNLNAKLLSIKSVSNKKARVLLDDLLHGNDKKEIFSRKMKNIPYGFNGIIYEKLYPYIQKFNISIENEIDYDIFDVLKPRRYNVLVEKLVIALDNAVEACTNSVAKVIIVNICEEEDNIVIRIRNSFASDINIDKIGVKDYSTKGRKRGLGLFFALRNNEASLKVKIINDFFVSEIRAKKSE